MGKIIVSENVTLDGVVQDPTGEDGFKFGGWFNPLSGTDREEWAKVEFAEARQAQALLLGRRSEEYFAARWLSRTGEWADRLNNMPKYVVSATLDEPRWSNSTLIRGDVVTEVAKLRQELAGEIVVYGSSLLVRALLEYDLVDEVRMIVFPVVLGTGVRLFGEMSDKKAMHLTGAEPIGGTLARLSYEIVRDA